MTAPHADEHRQVLEQALTVAQQELQALDNVDRQRRVRLEQLLAEIRELLAANSPLAAPTAGSAASTHQGTTGASSPAATKLIGRLREATEHFEEAHPTFSGLLGSVIDALARMGI